MSVARAEAQARAARAAAERDPANAAAYAGAASYVAKIATNATIGATKMNIASILSAACENAGLDPLAWGQISVADLIAARNGTEGATPTNVSPEAQIAYERGLRLASETRVAILEELLAERELALGVACESLIELQDACAGLEAAHQTADLIAAAGSPLAAVAASEVGS